MDQFILINLNQSVLLILFIYILKTFSFIIISVFFFVNWINIVVIEVHLISLSLDSYMINLNDSFMDWFSYYGLLNEYNNHIDLIEK